MTLTQQIVSFPPEANEKVGQYCVDHSVSLPEYINEHKEFTEQNVANAGIFLFSRSVSNIFLDKMVSTLQAQLFVWLASDRKARRILEIGCFSGMKMIF
jgi:predicted O-methyltransferase YrrM